jgi:catechol 2,3-dioxygenase-like lactoylglutathione lyase family enzyme
VALWAEGERMPRLQKVHPVLAARDVEAALRWYVERLGFRHAFGEGNYVGIRRDDVELHLQWNGQEEWERSDVGPSSLRLFVDDPDALFQEYASRDVFHAGTALRNTPWGTREFAFYDLNRHGLTFYRNLDG